MNTGSFWSAGGDYYQKALPSRMNTRGPDYFNPHLLSKDQLKYLQDQQDTDISPLVFYQHRVEQVLHPTCHTSQDHLVNFHVPRENI